MAALEESFSILRHGRGIAGAARKKALLLHCAGRDVVQKVFETLIDPGAPEGEHVTTSSKLRCEHLMLISHHRETYRTSVTSCAI